MDRRARGSSAKPAALLAKCGKRQKSQNLFFKARFWL